ncbi:MAG: ankyrin repeat domain-containing protein [Bacteroides sp.]|nr:ankyrin repeat domain-containing protein [Prevotella sp.]MCM1407016.1 ankyrin repeat domain-containing protein [Treponema brennaborense]MCM1470167.1 ankyrin repeat domain-containing protein [Bacteroides sp.]
MDNKVGEIAKISSSVSLFLDKFKNEQNEFSLKVNVSFVIISFVALLILILVISKIITKLREKKHRKRKMLIQQRLIIAAGNNDKDEVLNLLEKGAYVDYKDADGNAPLLNAVKNKNLSTVFNFFV